jgi:adenylate cyclase
MTAAAKHTKGSIQFSDEVRRRQRKHRLAILLTVTGTSVVMGAIIGLPVLHLVPSASVLDATPWFSVVVSAIFGLVVSFAITACELFVFNTRRMRSLGFWLLAAIRLFTYLAIMIVVSTLNAMFVIPPEMRNLQNFLQGLFISFIVSVIFNIVFLMTFFIGSKTLFFLIRGKYHHAREERMIIMFTDIVSSTSMAEAMSPGKFFALLSEFVYILETCVSCYGGFIYKFLGDGAIVTWRAERRNFAEAFAALLEIQKTLALNREHFVKHYDFEIKITAGLHQGEVMVGEIGDERRELGYMGNTVNTASRLQNACRDFGVWALVSRIFHNELLTATVDSDGIIWRDVGAIKLRGKEEEVAALAPQFAIVVE